MVTWRAAKRFEVSPREEHVFRRVNCAPDTLHGPVWVVMQGGSLAFVWLSATLAWRFDRKRLALVIAAVGTTVWGGVKLVKPLAGRGRPQGHLEAVRIRGRPQTGLGYPSGHAAVSTAVAIIATANARRWIPTAAFAAALMVGISRIYVGAHLPVDVAGGFGLGIVAGNLGVALLRALGSCTDRDR